MINRDKVRGALVGVVVGDALGMPVEGFKPEKIRQTFPDGIRRYEAPVDHKWFQGLSAGTTTDDTQLTFAVLRAVLETEDFDLDAIARKHVEAMSDPASNGWGASTKEAIRRLCNGVHWSESGKTTEPGRGTGNGVPMKVVPAALWRTCCGRANRLTFNRKLVALSAMTHYTKISAFATVVHTNVLYNLLMTDPQLYSNVWTVYDTVRDCLGLMDAGMAQEAGYYDLAHLEGGYGDIVEAFGKLPESERWDEGRLVEEFSGGSYYVGHSLPFSYAHFVRHPTSVQSLYSVVNAGGDTDSNGAVVGGMLGALNGLSVFLPEKHLLDIPPVEEAVRLADAFCDKFGVVR